MSMMGNFRQVSPALLGRLKANPSLTTEVVRWRPAGDVPRDDAEALMSFLPSHIRKAVERMPPDMRASFMAHANGAVADMPAEIKSQITAARAPGRPGKSSASSIERADVGDDLDLEKAWHGVHFLLCGSAGEAPGPLGTAVLGGTELGPDLGYGPARYLEPTEAKTVSQALDGLTAEAMAARFDAAAMERAQIYPSGWDDGDRQEWLAGAFSELQSFYRSTALKGSAVLLYIV